MSDNVSVDEPNPNAVFPMVNATFKETIKTTVSTHIIDLASFGFV